MRVTARIFLMAIALLVALVLHGLWRMVRAPSPWPRILLGSIAWIAGARAHVSGVPLRRDAFIIANHQSWLDILLLAGATGTAFIAKEELARVPLIGWLCTLNHTIFVARGDRSGVTRQIAAIADALADGWSVAIFPEGTTSDGTALLPFKAPLLAVVDPPPPGVRVQPVRIDYGAARSEVTWVGDEHGKDNVLRVLARRGTFPVRLHFCDPFDPATIGDRKAIAAEARARIEAKSLQPGSVPERGDDGA